ncbi:XRE family transcriptional regulator [Streptomyces sp. SID8014]|uniref:XRE family transcriptional regulator n=1 Tax=Streptomyces sp. SID8014 TaxID=2706097 RepID=UPI0031BBA191
MRIPYWVAPGQRIVLLTVFRKARMHEAAEVERAHQAQKVCEAEHGHVQRTYERRKELMQHSTWRTRRARQLAGEAVEYDQEYVDARLAGDLGQAVYNRRIELGLSQAELAEQAGMTELLGARRSG